MAPSADCYHVDVQILYDKSPSDTFWLIFDEMNQTLSVSENYYDENRTPVDEPAVLGSSEGSACLPKGTYYFVVYDSAGDGFSAKYFGYNLRFDGLLIAEGWNFTWQDTIAINMPYYPKQLPSSSPSDDVMIISPIVFNQTCSPVEVYISYETSPLDIIWSISNISTEDTTVTLDEVFFDENGQVATEPTRFGSLKGKTCLPDGDYEFLILDNYYFESGGNVSTTSYQVIDASSGAIIGNGGQIANEERFTFSIPFVQSTQPSPTMPSQQIFSGTDCHKVRVDLVYDSSPVGVTWVLNKLELENDGTETESLIRFFTATDSSLANLPLSTELCLDDGNYVFNIYDGLGDGICCDDGEGSYAIVVNDQQIAKGGDFEFQDAVNFSLPLDVGE